MIQEKYEIIKGFNKRTRFYSLPEIPLQELQVDDAICVDEGGGSVYQRWRARLRKICVVKDLFESDFKVCQRNGKVYIVRIELTQKTFAA